MRQYQLSKISLHQTRLPLSLQLRRHFSSRFDLRSSTISSVCVLHEHLIPL